MQFVKIKGIQCEQCRITITRAIETHFPGARVTFRGNTACIESASPLPPGELCQVIEEAGYRTKPEWVGEEAPHRWEDIQDSLAVIFAVLAVAFFLRHFFGFDLTSLIPAVDESIPLGLLFVTGLFTSLHCLSMCGALSLGASLSGATAANRLCRLPLKPLLYNAGRVISYSLLGGLVGAAGSVLSLSSPLASGVLLIGAVCMLLTALSLLGIIRFHLPPLLRVHLTGRKSAFVVGLLNGFMPCGALQAMQLYALSTGSLWGGMASMFLFSLGTVPLMLAFATVAAFLDSKKRLALSKVGAALILLLSLGMVSRALTAAGIALPAFSLEEAIGSWTGAGSSSGRGGAGGYLQAKTVGGVQRAEFNLDYSSYQNIQVKKGIPVELIIHADQDHLTGCNSAVVSRSLHFAQRLKPGTNVITFTPEESGTFVYSCWMNMIRAQIKVTE